MMDGWICRIGRLLPSERWRAMLFPHPSHFILALREGGVAGVEGGLAPKGRCLPPPERQNEDGSCGHGVWVRMRVGVFRWGTEMNRIRMGARGSRLLVLQGSLVGGSARGAL